MPEWTEDVKFITETYRDEKHKINGNHELDQLELIEAHTRLLQQRDAAINRLVECFSKNEVAKMLGVSSELVASVRRDHFKNLRKHPEPLVHVDNPFIRAGGLNEEPG